MKNADKPAYPVYGATGVPFTENGTDGGFSGWAKASDAIVGLTKREMFAMAAMQGMLSNSDLMNHESGFPPVRSVIDYADELLKALDS